MTDTIDTTINADGTAFDGGNTAIMVALVAFLALAAITQGFGLLAYL